MKTYAVVYVGAAILSIIGIPVLVRIAKRWGLVDKPGLRKIHDTPIPRIGGVMIMLPVLALTIPVFLLDNVIGDAFRRIQTQIVVLLGAGVFVFLIGFIDDVRNVRALTKLLCLIAAALAICLSGARIHSISLVPGSPVELGWLAWPITVLWIVTVTVGMNFIDGLDGLAGGIAAIVCAVITVLAFVTGQTVMAVLMLALLGSLTGFLAFNFNPARIFMGDCGSMFLGFFISAGSVVCAAKTATLAGIAIPAAVLGIPLLETAFTMIRRGIIDRRSIWTAERGHIHHRLLDLGLKHRHAVILLYAATLGAACLAMMMLVTRRFGTIFVLVGIYALLLMLFVFVGAARVKQTLEAIKRNRAIAREARGERRCFENAQLRIRDTPSFAGFWEAACGLAGDMDFTRFTLRPDVTNPSAGPSVWTRPGPAPDSTETIIVAMPVRNGAPKPTMYIEAHLLPNGSLETAGRRLSLLGRLIDEWITHNGHQFRPPPPPETQLSLRFPA